MNPQQRPDYRQSFLSMMGAVTFLAQAFAASAEMLLHTRIGSRFPGAPGAAVVVLIPLFTLFWQGYDVEPLLWYLGLYLFACAIERSNAAKRERRGEGEHSRYTGRPYLHMLLPRVDERKIKSTVEPVLVCVAGAIAVQLNEPLGWYLIFAAVGMIITVQQSLAYQRNRQTNLRDAYLEQKSLAEWFREDRNGW